DRAAARAQGARRDRAARAGPLDRGQRGCAAHARALPQADGREDVRGRRRGHERPGAPVVLRLLSRHRARVRGTRRSPRGDGGRGEVRMIPIFTGSFVALVTPSRNGEVDRAKLRELVGLHVANGTAGLVPCGTTGEWPTLSHDEHKRVIEVVVQAVRKRIKVLAGTGSNATAEALDLTRHAERTGADGALVVNPYYNKPTQEGLYRHFRAVAESVAIPIVVYNSQSRTAINVETATMARLVRDCTNVRGVKEASGNLDQ